MATSPTWKKPTDVMKRRLIRRRTSSATNSLTLKTMATGSAHQCSPSQPENTQCVPSLKRKNPFASGPQQVAKRRASSTGESLRSSRDLLNAASPLSSSINDGLSSTGAALFEALGKSNDLPSENTSRQPLVEIANVDANNTEDAKNDKVQEEKVKSCNSQTVQEKRQFLPAYPMDWSIKTRVRYTSDQPFSWCAPLKSHEESAGLVQHMKQSSSNMCQQIVGDSLEAKSELQRHCLLWAHPHIPWLKTFPRHVNDTKIGKPSAVFHSDHMQQALLNDWTRSLSSLFDLLRSGHCPYFYVCSHICAVLFRGPGIAEMTAMNAIVTPTTRGFRQALNEEGVEFSMPLHKIMKTPDSRSVETSEGATEKNPAVESSSKEGGSLPHHVSDPLGAQDEHNADVTESEATKNKDEITEKDDVTEADDVDDDITSTDAGASSWLETLGIDRKKYRTLDPNKVKMQRDSFKMIDNRPESAIYVEGSNCMALFNFLLNCRSLINNTGELAGVPPSLIAPVAFKGATLTSLTVKQGTIRQQTDNGSIKEAYSVEINGPILPDTVHNLNQIFRRTQGDFSASFSVQEVTTPFNVCLEKELRTVTKYLEEHKSTSDLEHNALPVAINDRNNGRQAIRELTCENNHFQWL